MFNIKISIGLFNKIHGQNPPATNKTLEH